MLLARSTMPVRFTHPRVAGLAPRRPEGLLVCSAILVTLLGPAEAAGRGIAARAFMGLLPLLLRDRLDGYEFLFLQSRIDAGQIFRRKLLEIVDHVFQFVIESVCAGDLLIGRPAFVARDSTV